MTEEKKMHRIADDHFEDHPAHTRWKEYEDLARERPKPQPTSSFHRREPTLFEQLCEWISRYWLLYLLLLAVAIAGTWLLIDSVRR